MAVAPIRIPAVGRGMSFPFEMVSGGVKPNMGVYPTEAEIQSAVYKVIRFVVGTAQGSTYMARGFGSTASETLFNTNNQAAASQLANSVSQALNEYASQIQWREIVVEPLTDELRVHVSYSTARSSAIRTVAVPFPRGR
jgi:phage baseplate assembly protein W